MKPRFTFALGGLLLLSGLGTLSGQTFLTSDPFDPPLGTAGDQVAINGSGFYTPAPVTSVWFNSTPVASGNFYVSSDNLIWAYVPAGATTGRIGLKKTAGSRVDSPRNFTVIGSGPYVTNFYNTVLGPGNVSGGAGTQLRLQGLHFFGANSQSIVTSVKFNGLPGSGLYVEDANDLVITAPPGVTSGPLLVTTTLGAFSTSTNTFSASTNFFVAPVIASFAPSAGRANTNLLIQGANFLGAAAVWFHDPSGSPNLQVVPTVISNNLMMVVAPVNVATGPLIVDAPAGSFTTTSNFVVQPIIYDVSPNHGSTGTNVTVTGANLYGLTGVKFGGVSAALPSPASVTYSSFVVVVPSGATNAPLSITTTNGAYTNSQLFYLPPRITSFTPTNSAQNSVVQITGTNLIGASSITFYGTDPVAVNNMTNNRQMTVVVPANVITGPIAVTTPAGTSVTNGTPYFCGAPAINTVSPAHAQVGATVTLTGTNFLFATNVLFNGTSAAFWVTNSGSIGTKVPTNAQTSPITVWGPAGSAASGSFGVDYISDLSVGMTDSPDPVFVGSNLFYTISITNNGPSAAPNVMLTDTLLADTLLTTNLGTLASGGKTVVTLNTVPPATGTITNTASVGSGNADLNMVNNSVTVTTTVWPIPVLSIARLTNQFRISWPAPLSNFTLQSTANPASNNSWSNLTNKPAIVGGQSIVIQTNTGTNAFFRLKN